MNLMLMPILVSFLVIGLFLAAVLVGGVMRFGRPTARAGKDLLVYAITTLFTGLTSCWIGFAVMLIAWPLERYEVHLGNVAISPPIAIFWAGGPIGIAVGAVLARRLIRRKQKPPTVDH